MGYINGPKKKKLGSTYVRIDSMGGNLGVKGMGK